jgi:hypothetical protein
MQRRFLSLLALPMLFLAQCAPSGCAPPPGTGRGVVIGIGQMQTFGYGGHVGADYLNASGGKICPNSQCGYWALRSFDPSGNVEGGGIPIDANGVREVHIEFYPDTQYTNWGTNDAWALPVGGVHVWDLDGGPINGISFPNAANGGFRINASATAGGGAIADGRLTAALFQIVPKDKSIGAFNVSASRGNQWTTGVVWPGDYIIFLTDHATGRSISVGANLTPGAAINVDLNRPCFGFPAC